MKIRTDFVTNSSSSSFICVRINDYKLKKEILKQNNIDINTIHETWRNNDYEDLDLKGGLICAISEGEVSYIGREISGDLYDKTVNQIKEEVAKTIAEEYKVSTTKDDIGFDYGEIYNG